MPPAGTCPPSRRPRKRIVPPTRVARGEIDSASGARTLRRSARVATPALAAGKYARHTVRDAPPRATLTLKRPSAVVTSGTLDVAVPALGVAANASTRAPAIGEPSARVTRPSIVCARAKLLVSVAFAEPRQSALRTAPPAVALAFVAHGAPFATVTLRSITVAAFPAASSTCTITSCSPFASCVVSTPTDVVTVATHGFTYRNAALPSLVPPASRQRPPSSSSGTRSTGAPSTLASASYTPAPASLAVKLTPLTPLTTAAVASVPPTFTTVGGACCSSVRSAA